MRSELHLLDILRAMHDPENKCACPLMPKIDAPSTMRKGPQPLTDMVARNTSEPVLDDPLDPRSQISEKRIGIGRALSSDVGVDIPQITTGQISQDKRSRHLRLTISDDIGKQGAR